MLEFYNSRYFIYLNLIGMFIGYTLIKKEIEQIGGNHVNKVRLFIGFTIIILSILVLIKRSGIIKNLI